MDNPPTQTMYQRLIEVRKRLAVAVRERDDLKKQLHRRDATTEAALPEMVLLQEFERGYDAGRAAVADDD